MWIIRDFFLAFVPIFVAVDAVGILPLFMGMTSGMDAKQRARVIRQSMVTALGVAVGFIFLGRSIFAFMGITPNDFKVAGGALLFLFAARDLLSEAKPEPQIREVGAVPLGTPLIVGPAVLTSILMLSQDKGIAITLASVVVNVVLAGGVLFSAGHLTRFLGDAGSRALSKVASVLLGAYAVMMIRVGLAAILTGKA